MGRPASKQATSRGSKRMSGFQRYDRCRFAIHLAPLLRGEPLIGTARFERDDLLGNILRIALEGDSPGRPDIIVAENEWQGLITPGRAYGCDYCLSSIQEALSVASASDWADLSATATGNVTLTITDSFVPPPPNPAHSSYSLGSDWWG